MTELWALTAFFNPCRYVNKLENFLEFADAVRAQGVKLFAIECVCHEDQPAELQQADCDRLRQVRSRSLLWQKEALLNVGLKDLPTEVDRFAWLDADILFDNPDWAKDASRLLDHFRLLQLFREVDGQPGTVVAQHFARDSRLIEGHPGYAWAARREWFPGFYDRAVVGGADNILGWAAFGTAGLWPGFGRERCYFSDLQIADIVRWSKEFHQAIDQRIACVEGSIRHFEHGSAQNRRYLERLLILKRHDFDPVSDVRLNFDGALEWASDKARLRREVARYFEERAEAA